MHDTDQSHKSAQEIAERSAETMMETDYCAQNLGIKLESVSPGYSRMSMEITSKMLNGHGICHGGIMFTLADTAFAYACNSRNVKTVALNCLINFAASAALGDRLTAECKEQLLQGRTGLYDVELRDQKNKCLALFRGTSYATSSVVFQAENG
jgi:acyl-CoA thioesterase